MSDINTILKELRIRKQFSVTKNSEGKSIYYFTGYESSLVNIESKLETCSSVKNITREFFTSGFGRICFELA